MIKYLFFECQNNKCGFRFPGPFQDDNNPVCPLCHHKTTLVSNKNINNQIPVSMAKHIHEIELVVVLDNIRSTYNSGAILRTCDGAGVNKVILAGITAKPDHPRINKTGLGAEWSIPIEYTRNSIFPIKTLKQQGYLIFGLEITSKSISLFESQLRPSSKMVLILGNEIAGIDPGLQQLCDQMVCIPMAGYKHSLNVSVAAGVAVYQILYGHSS